MLKMNAKQQNRMSSRLFNRMNELLCGFCSKRRGKLIKYPVQFKAWETVLIVERNGANYEVTEQGRVVAKVERLDNDRYRFLTTSASNLFLQSEANYRSESVFLESVIPVFAVKYNIASKELIEIEKECKTCKFYSLKDNRCSKPSFLQFDLSCWTISAEYAEFLQNHGIEGVKDNENINKNRA